MNNIKKILWIVLFGFIAILLYFAFNSVLNIKNIKLASGKIHIVAAENFWGSLVSQIGGNQVLVKSLVQDPNADPHQYEVSSADARLFARAKLIIVNGAGYDSWASSMLNANPNASREVLDVATLLNKKNGDNPHFWYNPAYVNRVILQIKNDLITLDPTQQKYFDNNYSHLVDSLAVYQNNLADIKKKYAGLKVGSTENIFVYLANSTGLDSISPSTFMQAVAEGTDPSATSVAEFQNQITSHQIKLLVYNSQTISPLTASLKNLAIQNHIPIVPISETIQPPNATFQTWMNNQIIDLKKEL